MTTIFDTFAHSCRNSVTHFVTSSDTNVTTAWLVSYIIRFDGRMIAPPALFPTGCCTYLSFTHVTTCALRSHHQFSGMTRM